MMRVSELRMEWSGLEVRRGREGKGKGKEGDVCR